MALQLQIIILKLLIIKIASSSWKVISIPIKMKRTIRLLIIQEQNTFKRNEIHK